MEVSSYSFDFMCLLMFMSLLLTQSTLIFLWWCSSCPSILLASLMGSLMVEGGFMVYSVPNSKLNVIIAILTMAGGLFILISFTIMSQPTDQVSVRSYMNKKVLTFLILLSMIWAIKTPLSTFLDSSNSGFIQEISISSSLSSPSSWSLIFLLFILLMSLKIVDSLIMEKGGMFSNSSKL